MTRQQSQVAELPPLRWRRYEIPHPEREKRAWSPQRVAAAARAVQRGKDIRPTMNPTATSSRAIPEHTRLGEYKSCSFLELPKFPQTCQCYR